MAKFRTKTDEMAQRDMQKSYDYEGWERLNAIHDAETAGGEEKVITLTAWLSGLSGYRIVEIETDSVADYEKKRPNSHKRKKTLLKRAVELEAIAKAEGVEITVRF